MFCPKCGNQINEDAKFCSRCGHAIAHSSDILSASGDKSYTLTITREKQLFAVNPAVKVVIDGKDKYQVANGSSVRIPISGGAHTIACSCGIRNKVLNIDITGDFSLTMKWNQVTGSLEVK